MKEATLPPLTCQREAFRLPPGLHYLNGAYMSPLPRAVEEAGLRGMARKRVPSEIAPTDFFEESDEVRRLFASLVNAPSPDSVAILPSVSYGVGVAARNTPVERGQSIVLLHEQFPGNVYAWLRLAREKGAEVRMVGPEGIREFLSTAGGRPGEEAAGKGMAAADERGPMAAGERSAAAAREGGAAGKQRAVAGAESTVTGADSGRHPAMQGEGRHPASHGRGRRWNERILEAIDDSTAVVSLAPVHWTDGTVFDLEAIGDRAREVGAAFIVDGTQSVGALPFDVQKLRPDALVVAGYKWLLGPYSIGLGYFGPRYQEGVPLEETWIAREGSEDFRALVEYQERYQPGAIRFDVGERSNFILVPMMAAALRLIREWRPERIQSYTRELSRGLLEEAADLGYAVEEAAFRAGHIFGLRPPAHLPMARLSEALREENVSASLRGSALRVSPNVYNDEEDIEALRRALRAAAG